MKLQPVGTQPADAPQRRPGRELLISALLVLVTCAVYWPVRHYDFVNHDDPVYVYENPQVQRGLSAAGVAWAFGRLTGEHTYWHPVTWLSLMLDRQLFGPGAGAFHVVNVGFHAANAALLFLVLLRMTGACWRSAAVAALFAWHPLQVDSVAWIAERKNVLSTFFWLLTMCAYVRYVEESKVQSLKSKVMGAESKVQSPKSKVLEREPCTTHHAWPYYTLMLVFFALGLMCKPMLVTVPAILLLLDVWPLRRISLSTINSQLSTLRRLFLEKVPLFLLSAASAAITIVGHQHLGSLTAEGTLPTGTRLGNAAISYARYLGKAFWPANLAVHYPHPGSWPPGWVAGASAVLLGVSVWTVMARRRRPYLLAGWVWFLVTLLPTIGIIQASSQAMADRFAYVPLIGLFIMVVWFVADLWPVGRGRGVAQALTTVAMLAACLVATRLQLRYWRDGEALFRRAVSVTKRNFLAEYSLGCALGAKNKLEEAQTHFAAALKIKPDYAEAHDNLGVVLQMQGKSTAAEAEFRAALRLKPGLTRAHNNLGLALQARGKGSEALAELHEMLRLQPNDPEAHNNLAKILAEQGKLAEAAAELEEAIRLRPDYAGAHYNLGSVFVLKGKLPEAIGPYLAALKAQPDYADADQALGLVSVALGKTNDAVKYFSEALRLKPDAAESHYRLGDILLNQGKAEEAERHFSAALQSRPDYPEAHYQLGVILAGRKQTAEAIPHLREAVRLKPDWLEALNNLAWLLATEPDDKLRNGAEAVRLATHAVELTRTNNPGALDTLGAAYAEVGRFSDAVQTAEEAAWKARSSGQIDLSVQLTERVKLYQAQRPFRE
jgi:protein O-mannosyl-transferase